MKSLMSADPDIIIARPVEKACPTGDLSDLVPENTGQVDFYGPLVLEFNEKIKHY